MKQQVDAFNAVLEALEAYAVLLNAGAELLAGNHEIPQALSQSLRQDGDHTDYSNVARRLNAGAEAARGHRASLIRELAAENAVGARSSVPSAFRSLDRTLELSVDGQSPLSAMIPPPFRYLQGTRQIFDLAFPFEVGGPLRTTEVTAFEQYLQGPENPWRR